jgi:hypothetical protein
MMALSFVHEYPSLLGYTGTQIAGFAVFAAILTMVMISTRSRTQRNMQAPRHTARERYTSAKDQGKSLREIEDVMLELDKLAREVHGRLDTRFAKLEVVIRDADERIAKLERLTGSPEPKSAPRVDVTLSEEQPDAPVPPPTMADSPHADVYRLADAGLTEMKIAEETGKTMGEVELILTLRRAQGGADQSSPAPNPATATG